MVETRKQTPLHLPSVTESGSHWIVSAIEVRPNSSGKTDGRLQEFVRGISAAGTSCCVLMASRFPAARLPHDGDPEGQSSAARRRLRVQRVFAPSCAPCAGFGRSRGVSSLLRQALTTLWRELLWLRDVADAEGERLEPASDGHSSGGLPLSRNLQPIARVTDAIRVRTRNGDGSVHLPLSHANTHTCCHTASN